MQRRVKRLLPSGIEGFAFRHKGRLIVVLSKDLSETRAQVVETLLGLQGGFFGVVLAQRRAKRATG